jgi:Zn-dependent protease with chaperone function
LKADCSGTFAAVNAGRRGYLLLFGLVLIAFANGFFLALSLYGLLAVVLHLFGSRPPGFGLAIAAAIAAGAALLAVAWGRERALRLDLAGDFSRIRSLGREESPLVEWLAGLPGSDSPPPALKLVEGGANAFTVGSSREQASIVITTGLLELSRREQEAILAHEVAHVRTQDLRAIGLADALAGTVEDLAEAKGRIFWGPRRIFIEMLPFTIAMLAGLVLISLLPETSSNPGSLLIGFVFVILIFGYFYALWRSTIASWRGLLQLFVYCTFLGPLTLLEALLAPPTAVALSRLLSRSRVYESDETAVELIGGQQPLVAALQRLAYVEEAPSEEWFGGLRFSLFVTPRARSGWRGWLERIFATHPSVSSRLQALAEAQERSRDPELSKRAGERLEQSG